MDQLEQTLRDGRAMLVPPAYGVADVVWTVFLGRMEFAGLGAEIPKRPALARYWAALQARPQLFRCGYMDEVSYRPPDRRDFGYRQKLTASVARRQMRLSV